MSDLSTVKQVLAGIDSEARRLRAAIEANRQARETLAAAPLPKADVLAIMQSACDHWAAQAPGMLARSVAAIASRPGKSAAEWGGNTPVLPDLPADISRLLSGLLASSLKSGLAAAFDNVPEVEGAGDPWAERESTLAALDAAIESDEADLEALRAQVQAAGLRWPGGEIY